MATKKKNRSKKNKIKLGIVISMLSLLALIMAVLMAGGGVALYLYNQMNYQKLEQTEMDQAFIEAEKAMQNGVPLDVILKDSNHRFTLSDIQDLQDRYLDWLQSQTGEEDSIDISDLFIDPPKNEPLPPEAADLINILCLGTDERSEGTRGRTDTIMMVTINTKNKTITMTSFLRDSYVKYSGTSSSGKLNAAYVYGGVSGLQNTLYDYFQIDFDNYAQVNFNSFEKVIDALGGIDIDLTDKEIANLVKHSGYDGKKVFVPEDHLIAGTERTYHLNGQYALRLCRDRYANDAGQGDGDFGRTERQRRVLTKVIEKAQKMSVGQLMDLIPVVLPMITTDLTVADCANLLASVGTTYTQYKIQSYRVPDKGTYSYERINGSSVLAVDFVTNKNRLHALVFD